MAWEAQQPRKPNEPFRFEFGFIMFMWTNLLWDKNFKNVVGQLSTVVNARLVVLNVISVSVLKNISQTFSFKHAVTSGKVQFVWFVRVYVIKKCLYQIYFTNVIMKDKHLNTAKGWPN
ncbi:Hypothetical_protein [Hexamita inflata]|uniref:Hypothetical_protein n=1 Tax=Hexamita inflata TaxID=28002 RepID=A0AA86RN41_9EUKA|nr:Hypothetical protein HINF_LOCUS65518 [Hexamita inflata]